MRRNCHLEYSLLFESRVLSMPCLKLMLPLPCVSFLPGRLGQTCLMCPPGCMWWNEGLSWIHLGSVWLPCPSEALEFLEVSTDPSPGWRSSRISFQCCHCAQNQLWCWKSGWQLGLSELLLPFWSMVNRETKLKYSSPLPSNSSVCFRKCGFIYFYFYSYKSK